MIARHTLARSLVAACLCLPIFAVQAAHGQEARADYQVHKDIPYAQVEGRVLLVDLYLPRDTSNPPLLVWVHGGAWSRGTKSSVGPLGLASAGYAIASVDFRLSGEAPFPAQIHDIKAAIRFLRAEAHTYGYKANRIAIGGNSSGGHLAAFVGVTNGHAAFEGEVGDHLDQSSSVQAIVDYYGPTNLASILPQSTPHGLSVRQPALDLLLGGQPEAVPEVAELASVVTHVDASDPPLLILHGDQDPQVPINQSHELHGAYKELGLPVHFEVVHGAAHGGPAFYDAERYALVRRFMEKALSDS